MLALCRDLSMLNDMRDPSRANAGFAANIFCPHCILVFGQLLQLQSGSTMIQMGVVNSPNWP